MQRWIYSLCSFLLLWNLCSCDDLYSIKSSVSPLNERNFGKQITSMRLRDVNMILFYKDVGICSLINFSLDAKVIAVARRYEEFANEYRGVFRIFYVNCAAEEALCNKQSVKTFPSIRIFPPHPIPASEFQIVNKKKSYTRNRVKYSIQKNFVLKLLLTCQSQKLMF